VPVEPVEPAPPAPPAPPAEAALAGGRVVSPDSRADAARVPTVLTFADPAGAKVDLRGPGGFKAEWDGKAPFDLGPAGDGPYTASFVTPSKTFRLKRFTVEGGKKACEFGFDPANGEWSGGCR
jgi:hypothetical protein